MRSANDGWRWANVPLPEPYLAALAAAAILHWIAPVRLPFSRPVGRSVGWPLVAGGLGLIWWAVGSAGTTQVDRPSELVTGGAYAISRNPMYLGWSIAIVGIGAITREGWVLIGSALGAAALHRAIIGEEARLAAAFGERYAAYRARVGLILGRRRETDEH